ncbi:MAG: hypothetical protein KGH75_00890 [Rhodospirillales bacterium]|nr:hypothetical protein [Rhodospirillales bacterium]
MHPLAAFPTSPQFPLWGVPDGPPSLPPAAALLAVALLREARALRRRALRRARPRRLLLAAAILATEAATLRAEAGR